MTNIQANLFLDLNNNPSEVKSHPLMDKTVVLDHQSDICDHLQQAEDINMQDIRETVAAELFSNRDIEHSKQCNKQI